MAPIAPGQLRTEQEREGHDDRVELERAGPDERSEDVLVDEPADQHDDGDDDRNLGMDQAGNDDRRQPRDVRPVDRDGHDQPGEEREGRGERDPEQQAHEERPDAIQPTEDDLAADESGSGGPDAPAEEHRVVTLLGRRQVETDAHDLVAVDRHEHGQADHDDRVDERPERGHEPAEQPDHRVGEAREEVPDDRVEGPHDIDAMPRASNQDWMSARIDGGLAARPGNAAAISMNESTSEMRTFTITRALTRMTGTMTAMTATGRGRRVSRRWSQSATGETRNASSQAKKKMRMSRK